nr:unnamed protein product [Anser cygnoides domesticus]
MLTYGKVALHAPKSELLACVEEDILANILELFHACRKELQHKLALVNSIKEVTCAIQAADTKHSFRLCKKPEVLEILLDLMEEDACDTPVSQVHLKMLQLLEQLSTLKPCMDWENRCSQVAVCCWRVLSCPPEETELQSLQASCEEALGQLVSALLKAEGTSSAFADVVSVSIHEAVGQSWGLRGCPEEDPFPAAVPGQAKERALREAKPRARLPSARLAQGDAGGETAPG